MAPSKEYWEGVDEGRKTLPPDWEEEFMLDCLLPMTVSDEQRQRMLERYRKALPVLGPEGAALYMRLADDA